MKRRAFISGLGCAAATWPAAARAQQPVMPAIGFLSSQSAETNLDLVRAFRQALRVTGHIEGENLAIEYRWAENQIDRLPMLVADLVRRRVAVIAVVGGPASAAVAKATSTIPIVFAVPEDPSRLGLSRASRGRAETRPASIFLPWNWRASAWSFSLSLCLPRLVSPSCSIRPKQRLPRPI
jgi:ABC-type uncharacterized transport system substrate-binding protein